jgi:predicted membrane protein
VLLWLQADRSGLQIAAIQEESGKMPLVNLVLVLIVVGVALWLINRYIPMASSIKTILNVVVVVAVGVWVLKAVGLWGSVSSFKVGQ